MPPILSAVVRAVIRLREGDIEASRAEVMAMDRALPHCAVNTMVTLAEAVAEVGPPEMAKTLIERLTPHGDTFAIWGLFGLTCGLPVATMLGCLQASFGEGPRAIQAFEDATERTTSVSARAPRAWTRYVYGRALVRKLGDPLKGRALLEEARKESSALGMGRLAERCNEALSVEERTESDLSISRPAIRDWTICREGAAWRIERSGRNMLLPPLRGMPMIARLVETPDIEVHCLELVSGAPGHAVDNGDAGAHLDDQARAAYRRRAAELSERIAEAEERGDADRADVAQSELDVLRREVARATGLGGRTRKAGAAAERARISAQRRIREATRRIRELDVDLADELDRTIQTGIYCMYAPRRRKRP